MSEAPPPAAEIFDPNQVLEVLARAHGARIAAWLIFRNRRTIHRTGHALLHVPVDAEGRAPLWMQIGMKFLAMRERMWQVSEVEEPARLDGARQWLIFWKGWLSNGPRHREELQRRDRNERKRARRLRS